MAYSAGSDTELMPPTAFSNSTLHPPFSGTKQTATTDNYPMVMLLNPTSLAKPNALELVYLDLKTFMIDIFLVSETWFTSTHSESTTSIPGYDCFRRDRGKRKGRGICIIVYMLIVNIRLKCLTCLAMFLQLY